MKRNTFAVVVVLLVAAQAAAEDQKLHSFIKPYAGSVPHGDPMIEEFGEVNIIVSKARENPVSGVKKIEGKITQLHYTIPEGRSSLEVAKNYEGALLRAGFETVFTCSEAECGDTFAPMPTWKGSVNQFVTSRERLVTAKLNRPEGTVWVSVLVQFVGNPLTKIIIAEEKPMETGLVQVDAAALKSALERDGHIAVYGIVFDSGRATLKPESAAALQEVKKLLDQDPKLKLYVVGHTDDVGEPSANVALSNSRATAVVNELTRQHKVAGARLKAQGVGPYVPVASNRNEAGRSKNRRVELVESTH